MDQPVAQTAALLERTTRAASEALPAIVSGVVVTILFLAAAAAVRFLLRRLGARLGAERRPLANLASQTVWFALITVGVVSGLGTMGVDVSAMVASLGLTGFALGFALRDALSNLLAGVLVMVHRPFRTGDTIAVTGIAGRVRSIDLRYTVLEANGKTILVLNSVLFTNTVTVESAGAQ